MLRRLGSAELIKNNYPSVSLILNEKNLGFAAANNIAIKNSSSKYVLLINSDCEVYEKSIEKLVAFMEENIDGGVTGPKIINADGTTQLSCRRFPSFFDAGMHAILHNIAPNNRFSRRYKLADAEGTSLLKWTGYPLMHAYKAPGTG